MHCPWAPTTATPSEQISPQMLLQREYQRLHHPTVYVEHWNKPHYLSVNYSNYLSVYSNYLSVNYLSVGFSMIPPRFQLLKRATLRGSHCAASQGKFVYMFAYTRRMRMRIYICLTRRVRVQVCSLTGRCIYGCAQCSRVVEADRCMYILLALFRCLVSLK